MTANDIRAALRTKYHDSRQYAIAEEVGLTTGFSHRRLDMMILDCYNSNGFRIDGFEIKVSTSDLRRELEDPEKHVAFFDVIDYYTIAVPVGVADPLLDIIPKKWGILIVNEDGTTRFKRRPLALEDRKADKAVPRGFFASIVRAVQSRQPAEQELRKEYERGKSEGKAEAERHQAYTSNRVQREAAKLDAYDKLCSRFSLYRDDKIDEVMDEFEAFRKLNIDWLRSDITGTINRLTNLRDMLGGAGNENQ
ncbi:MAG: hypothetical protein IJK23_09830 [Clostridia bacterium]|nr:hypothetical protein [Clostridia bacterium]